MMTKSKDVLLQVICLVIGFILLIPIIYAFSISLMEKKELIMQAGRLFPSKITWENYQKVFKMVPIGRYLVNSLFIAMTASFSRIIVALMSAYAFSFLEFKWKDEIFTWFVFATLIPTEVMMLPNYRLIANLGWVNTYIGILSVSLVSLPNLILMRQHLKGFPSALKEAAEIDGCNHWQFIRWILLPMSMPIIVTIFMTSFISMWNDYMWPLIVTTSEEMRTIQIGVTMIKDRDSINFGPVMAGTIISMVPSVLIYLVFQRRIIEGMTNGAVKQ